MSEPREDVLDKLDALLKKHVASEPDIPVLTDILAPPLVDLDIIPVLTEEIDLASPALPATPIELDFVHNKPVLNDPALRHAETAAMLARLEAVEAEVQADVEARIAKVQAAPGQTPSIEISQYARYVALPLTPTAEPTSAPTLLPDETVKKIAALIEADVARILKTSLHQTLSEELSGMLNSSLDKALSSMLDQFMIHIEDVVRTSIADELQKQLAPFKRPVPTNNS